ncbi:MAG TPA: hypothetical protein VHM90_16600 [Phycisphaerae bacterium]|nr:hypothetical protein [Phycisphaerae bacterium]
MDERLRDELEGCYECDRNLCKAMRLGYRGIIGDLDEEGQSLLWRSGDLRARMLLNDIGISLIEKEGEPIVIENRRAMASLIHAERYLADRLAYELAPWPKNLIRDESSDPDRCPHCRKLIVDPNHCSVCKLDFCGIECCLTHEHSGVE